MRKRGSLIISDSTVEILKNFNIEHFNLNYSANINALYFKFCRI